MDISPTESGGDSDQDFLLLLTFHSFPVPFGIC